MTVIKAPDERHLCRPEPGIVIKPYRNGRLAAYIEETGYLMEYPPGSTLICDECDKAYTAEGWADWCNHAALVHRETTSERKLRETRR